MMSASGDGLTDWITPLRCALLVVDLQVDFASPEGALGSAGVDLSTVGPAVVAAERLTDAARRSGASLVFVGLRTTAESDSPVWAERSRRLGGIPGSALCRRGSAGAAFVGPLPAPGEMIVTKTRYSAFHDTDLAARLRAAGIDTVVICGLTTECCVDATARDAYQRDFHVFVASDACAAYEPDLHVAALRGLELNCAILVSSEAVVEAWDGAR